MRKARNIVLLILLFIMLMVGWPWLMQKIWPDKPKPESAMAKLGRESAGEGAAIPLPNPDQEAVALVTGSVIVGVKPVSAFDHTQIPPPLSQVGEWFAAEGIRHGIPKPSLESVAIITGGVVARTRTARRLEVLGTLPADTQPEMKANPADLMDLIALGHGTKPFYIQAILNTRGGSVQQVILSAFDEADREGREVKINGKPKRLHLIPGLQRPRAKSLREQTEIGRNEPELVPGKIDARTYESLGYPLAPPSFVIFHYEKPGDERPLDTLGTREWKVIDVSNDETADEQYVVFQTELAEPYNVLITKTFTLKRKEYHIGLQIDISRLPGKAGLSQFRYQLQGANGLPIEGEWYTSTYRQAIVGFGDDKGKRSRYVEDARSIRLTEGGDRKQRPNDSAIRYAAVAVQYFASVIAVDDQQENRRFIEFARATPVYDKPLLREKIPNKEPKDWKYWDFLDDLTIRAVTEEFDPGKGASHKYVLYQGPIKVRLLGQLSNEMGTVDDGLVDRYLDKLTLNTMTDEHLPNWFGRRASDIGWTDLVVAFTNLIHSLLYYLYQIVPNLGVCIILLTIIVRGLLHPLSRRQAYNAQIMQAKMAKLQPELKKLQEKFKDDFNRMNQERMKLYREHGINPFAALGGCFMLLLQMPVFMGLYYALQESVFFRLDRFLWIPNLAAPDMLVRWGESIPWISAPENIGGDIYLGPFFNVLPIIAVVLMLYQQKKMMPVSDDPQVQAQQRMMKFMMILFGLFFYKVAAGLCIYFIVSSLWGLAERKFMPKAPPPGEGPNDGSDPNGNNDEEEDRPLGWWGRKKAGWKEKWKRILEEAQKQAEYRRDQNQSRQPGATPPPSPGRGGAKKKKKKR